MNKIFKLVGIVVFSFILAACSGTADRSSTTQQSTSSSLAGRFIWHDLVSDDIERSKQFYGALFDWKFEDVERLNGRPYALIKHQGAYIGGITEVAAPADGVEISRWLGYLSVPDIDLALAYTQSAGGEIVVPAQEIQMIGRAAAIKDPEGAVIGLISSKLPLPDELKTPPPGSIVWNELLASSPQDAADFYRSLSNAEVALIERRGGEYRLLLSAGIKRAGIMKNPAQNLSPLWLTYFSASDPEQAAERAKALGGEILIPASPELREGSMAIISDPTGAILVLQKNTL